MYGVIKLYSILLYFTVVQLDMTRVFNNVLQQQTQLKDGLWGELTVTHFYIEFYSDLLKRIITRNITPPAIYSPVLRGFVSVTAESANLPAPIASALGLSTNLAVFQQHLTASAAQTASNAGAQPPLPPVFIEHFASWTGYALAVEI